MTARLLHHVTVVEQFRKQDEVGEVHGQGTLTVEAKRLLCTAATVAVSSAITISARITSEEGGRGRGGAVQMSHHGRHTHHHLQQLQSGDHPAQRVG